MVCCVDYVNKMHLKFLECVASRWSKLALSHSICLSRYLNPSYIYRLR